MEESLKDNVSNTVNVNDVYVDDVYVDDVCGGSSSDDADCENESTAEESSKPAGKALDDSSDGQNDFKKIILDFSRDILKTYPELDGNLHEDIVRILKDENDDAAIGRLYAYCKTVYPERFFDILYQNEDIFDNEETNTLFLPNLDFKSLWKENISENTREQIWKYLQLILFTIITSLQGEESFGDTAKMFEAINQTEFRNKLEDTIKGMKDMFETGKSEGSGEKKPGIPNMPNPEDIHKHINGIMDGKLGKLAKEIAEETAKDLNIDVNDGQSVDGIFQSLFKQPTKLMSLVKNVGGKLDEKMKSGDIKESELLEEASNIMKKMKNMPGMANFKDIFSKMGMNVPNGKMDLNAMKNNINRNIKNAKQKERMQDKLQRRKLERDGEQLRNELLMKQNSNLHTVGTENGMEKMVFSTGESYEKTSKEQRSTSNKKKKKKKK